MLWECKHFLPAGQKVMLKMSLVAQLIAEVRDLNRVWQLRPFSKDREERQRSLSSLDLICGFRETRGLAVRDNKAGICDV